MPFVIMLLIANVPVLPQALNDLEQAEAKQLFSYHEIP